MSQTQPPLKVPSRSTVVPGTTTTARAVAAAPPVSLSDPSQRTPLIILGGLVLLLVLAYWDMFALTSAAWSEGLYSHGWIVPLGAVWLMWLRWEPFGEVPAR